MHIQSYNTCPRCSLLADCSTQKRSRSGGVIRQFYPARRQARACWITGPRSEDLAEREDNRNASATGTFARASGRFIPHVGDSSLRTAVYITLGIMKTALERTQTIKNIVLLRALVAVYLLCAIWFRVAPDTLSESLRAVERALDTPEYESLDSVVVPLLFARSFFCLLLWSPTRIVAWLFALSELLVFGFGAFGGPIFMSPADSVVDGVQAMSVTAILTILFIDGVFGRTNKRGEHDA